MTQKNVADKIHSVNQHFTYLEIDKLVKSLNEKRFLGISENTQVIINGFGRVIDIKIDSKANLIIALNNAINDYTSAFEGLYNYQGDLDIFDIINLITKRFDES